MLEDDDEAFMIHPDTKEILAAVEFADARTTEPQSRPPPDAVRLPRRTRRRR